VVGDFGSAISEHPITAEATGEVIGSVLESVGESPDLAVVFVTPAHGGALEDVGRTVEHIVQPNVLIGAVCSSVVGPGREVERGPGISLWTARTGPISAISLERAGAAGFEETSGWPEEGGLGFEPEALLLLADPFSFPAEGFLNWLGHRHPDMPVVGGLASAANTPGGNSLLIGDRIRRDGAVGVLLGSGVTVEPLVSQGCRPFGRPLVVTRSESNVIFELAGRPALERLVTQASSDLTEDEVESLTVGGLQIGRVIDEHKEQFSKDDFLIRSVLGTDPRSGAVIVGDVVPVGVTVQFHLRDAATAHTDLSERLGGRRAEAALLFTCTGRGSRLFGGPDHDAGAVLEHLGAIPVAGCFSAGEIGPIAGRNFLHGFTASLALFRSSRTSRNTRITPASQQAVTTRWSAETGDTVT
jgi:small ligand-binding sensory domain FIST